MSVGSFLLDLLYPPKCLFCQRQLARGERDLCASCRRTLPVCGRLYHVGPALMAACVALWYEGTVREAVHRFKFGGMPHYAGGFGTLVAAAACRLPLGQIDAVSWIPISRARLRSRGYDQARLLARSAAPLLKKPLERTLEKWRDNLPQSLLKDARERRENVRGVYRLGPGAAVAGRTWLLIDDVLTTGSTALEAAGVLRAAGAEAVYLAALATGRASVERG